MKLRHLRYIVAVADQGSIKVWSGMIDARAAVLVATVPA
jgi:hypothetical protein